jgi:hypothetical protein
MKIIAHFRKITHHKILLMKYCFKVGLYKQGLLHDLSKYSWTEFRVGCKYYQGTRSPNNAEREETGVSMAWLHHKGRNKHHYEYWIDYGLGEDMGKMVGMEMPVRYVVEMFLDRVAACHNYAGDAYTDQAPLAYYQKGKLNYLIHKNTAALLEELLYMLAEKGEEETLSYIKNDVLRRKPEAHQASHSG